MTFSYDAGTTTPGLAGLVEVGSIRVNDGTFELTGAPGLLLGTPDLRDAVSTFSQDHGGFPGAAFYNPRDFTLEGQIRVPVREDLWGAIDLLFATFAGAVLTTVSVNTSGWTEARQTVARLSGPITIIGPDDFDGHLARKREFTVPLIAPDPRLYSTTLHSQSLSTGGSSVTNAGNVETPITVRFNGPVVNPSVRDPDGLLISYAGTIASGHYVEVTTNPATDTGITALDDLGANVYGDITVFKARAMAPGASTWSKVIDSGAGAVTLSWRDAWA